MKTNADEKRWMSSNHKKLVIDLSKGGSAVWGDADENGGDDYELQWRPEAEWQRRKVRQKQNDEVWFWSSRNPERKNWKNENRNSLKLFFFFLYLKTKN